MFEDAGDARLPAEELEAVGIGHTGAPQFAVLGQHLMGPDVAVLVVGDAVADIPVDALDLLPVAQIGEAGDEVLGVRRGGSVEFLVLDFTEVAVRIGGQPVAWVCAKGSEDGVDLPEFLLPAFLSFLVIPPQVEAPLDRRPEGSGLPGGHRLSDGVVDLLGEVTGERGGVDLGGVVGRHHRRSLVLIGRPACDHDRVGLRVVAHAEVHRLADVPEFHIVMALDGVGLQLHLPTVYEEPLGAWCSLQVVLRGAGEWPCHADTEEHSCCQGEDGLLCFHIRACLSPLARCILQPQRYHNACRKAIGGGESYQFRHI